MALIALLMGCYRQSKRRTAVFLAHGPGSALLARRWP